MIRSQLVPVNSTSNLGNEKYLPCWFLLQEGVEEKLWQTIAVSNDSEQKGQVP